MVVAWGIALLLAWKECSEHIDEFYDTQQMLFAKRLASANLGTLTDRLPSTQSVFKGDQKAEKGVFEDDALAFAVFRRNGELVLTDGQKGDNIVFQNKLTGFTEAPLFGSPEPWRIVWLYSVDGDFIVAVGQEVDFRDDMAMDMLQKLVSPWILLVPMLFVGFIWILSKELAPLHELTHLLENRQADDTSSLRLRRVPSEIRFTVKALNSLFLRVGALLTRERAFISDAAHELRTPLTALRVQTEVAGLSKNDHAALERALGKMLQGIDRSALLVDQLLTLSRLESLQDIGSSELTYCKIDWPSMLDEIVMEHRARAEKKGIDLKSVMSEEPDPFTGYPMLLTLLLRNLCDNAVKHTPEGGDISIRLDRHQLVIENSGPGIPESFVPLLGERFARPPGQSSPGSGLGLSIAKRAAAINGLHLSLQNRLDGSGFVAQITFS